MDGTMEKIIKWFKYNKNRAITIVLGIGAIVLALLYGSSDEIEYALGIVLFLLPFFLIPEIIKYSKMFIAYYKKL